MNQSNDQNDLSDAKIASMNKRALVVFSIIAGYFLLTEHLAHVIQALPYLLIIVCVGMHFFMHRGHGHGTGDSKYSENRKDFQGKR